MRWLIKDLIVRLNMAPPLTNTVCRHDFVLELLQLKKALDDVLRKNRALVRQIKEAEKTKGGGR